MKERRAILTNPDEDFGSEWASPDECVWLSPAFLTIRPSLSRQNMYRHNPHVVDLFIKVLNISNAGCTDFINQLGLLSTQGFPNADVNAIYKCIRDEIREKRAESKDVL